MSVASLIELKVRDGRRNRFLELLTDVLDTMAHEATYIAATLHEDSGDPHRFLLHEVWADHEDVVNVQIHRPYRQEWHAVLPNSWRLSGASRSGGPFSRDGKPFRRAR